MAALPPAQLRFPWCDLGSDPAPGAVCACEPDQPLFVGIGEDFVLQFYVSGIPEDRIYTGHVSFLSLPSDFSFQKFQPKKESLNQLSRLVNLSWKQ